MKNFLKYVLGYFNAGKSYHGRNAKIKIPYDSHVFSLPSESDFKNHFIIKCLQKIKFNPNETTFVDVGANVGQTLLAVKNEYESIEYIGFDPNPVCVNFLNKLIRTNNFRNAKIVPTGLSNESEIVEFYKRYSHDPCGSMVKEIRPELDVEPPTIVPVLRFDNLKLKLRKNIIIKVDVEGAELEVLKGMQNFLVQNEPIIICEVLHIDKHADENLVRRRAEELGNYLRGLGYQIQNINHNGSVSFVPVNNFIMKKWDDQKSIYECDYLLMKENTLELVQE